MYFNWEVCLCLKFWLEMTPENYSPMRCELMEIAKRVLGLMGEMGDVWFWSGIWKDGLEVANFNVVGKSIGYDLTRG